MLQSDARTAGGRETVAEALRRWIDANEKGLNGFTGAGVIPIAVHFNTEARGGQGEYKVRLGA